MRFTIRISGYLPTASIKGTRTTYIRIPFLELLIVGISDSSLSSICLPAYFLVSRAIVSERN
jgi:hypothetical protein